MPFSTLFGDNVTIRTIYVPGCEEAGSAFFVVVFVVPGFLLSTPGLAPPFVVFSVL
jgi:hypothetical protein